LDQESATLTFGGTNPILTTNGAGTKLKKPQVRPENLTADIKCCNDKGGYGQIDQGSAAPLRQFYLSGACL
jgi:hypothetical protein